MLLDALLGFYLVLAPMREGGDPVTTGIPIATERATAISFTRRGHRVLDPSFRGNDSGVLGASLLS